MSSRTPILVAIVALGASCSHGTFIHVTVTANGSISFTSLDVTVENAQQSTKVQFDQGGKVLSSPQSFVLGLDPDRRGDAVITVRALNGQAEVAQATALARIIVGGTADLTLNLTPDIADMGS